MKPLTLLTHSSIIIIIIVIIIIIMAQLSCYTAWTEIVEMSALSQVCQTKVMANRSPVEPTTPPLACTTIIRGAY